MPNISTLIFSAGLLLGAQSGTCDRACLEGFVDRYLDALVAHDPKMLPLARNVKFTENGVRLEIGDSQWKTVTGGPPDPWTWQIAELFKIEKGKIRQIEAILLRSAYGMNSGWSGWEDGLSSGARDVTK